MSTAQPYIDMTEFQNSVFDFFGRTRGGHLDKYAYLIPINWENLVAAAEQGHSTYYLARPDVEAPVLERIAQKEALLKGNGAAITQIFEIGPGTGQKILPFIENIKSLKSAILIDYEMDFNGAAHDRIRQIRDDLAVTMVQQDFEAPKQHVRMSGNTLGLILGGTICNISGRTEDYADFPHAKLAARFNNVAKFYHENGYLVVTTDGGSPEQFMGAYSDQFNQDFVMGALELIPQLMNTSLTKEQIRECFVHEPLYIPESRMLAHTAKCIKDIDFTIDGQPFHISAGWSNSIINSFKPNEEDVIAAADEAGFRYQETFQDGNQLIKILKFKYVRPSVVQGDDQHYATGPITGGKGPTGTAQFAPRI